MSINNQKFGFLSQSIDAITASLYTTTTSGSSAISFSNNIDCMRILVTGTTNNFLLLPPSTTVRNAWIQGVAFTAHSTLTASFDIKFAAGTASILNAPFTGVLAANTVYTCSLNTTTAYNFVQNGIRMNLTSSDVTGTLQVSVFYKQQIL